MDQGESPGGPPELKTAIGWLAFVCGALAVSVEVFLHRSRTFGERYIGMQAAAVILLVPLYSLFWEGYDLLPLVRFLGAFYVMCVLARLGVAFRRRRGRPQEHTRYSGYPRVMRLMPKVNEGTVKAIVEPVVVFFGGVFMMQVSQPLGGYLMLASAGLLVSVHLNVSYERVRALDMHDAYLEQRNVAGRFREMHSDRR